MIKKFSLLLVLLLLSPLAFSQSEEPLDPKIAYAFSAKAIDENTIQAIWEIHEGYYMYRNKIRFEANTPGVELGEATLPKGKIKNDQFFGEMEVYRNTITIDIPILSNTDAAKTIEIKAHSQGCADIGLCYPPIEQTSLIDLPSESGGISLFSGLGERLGIGSSEPEFLEPDQAYIYIADIKDGNTIVARWDIADGYYLYRDKTSFEIKDSNDISLGKIDMPNGKKKVDEYFGEMEVYYHNAEVIVPLNRNNLDATEITLVATYQGCAEAGLCYPPITKTLMLALPEANAATANTQSDNQSPPEGTAKLLSEQDQLAQSLATSTVMVTIATFFGLGLLLAFTPCVFPMIPILSSIIAGQGSNITTRKAFFMSLVYVLAMAFTYTIAGVIAGLFGENLQAAFQNPWILSTFSLVFVLLALSMFGFYEIQLPSSLQSKLSEFSNRQEGGTMIGVAIMGLLSALIVGPCVAPPLAGALIYIGQSGDALLGGMALFALSLGMGIPLIVIGTSAGKLIPKAGVWMDAIKAVFGVLLLAVAIWMMERILPEVVIMLLWGILLIVSAIYMGALEQIHPESTGWRRLWKGVGLVLFTYGILLMIGAASGGKDPLQPLRGISIAATGQSTTSTQELHFTTIKTVDDLNRELSSASAQGKPVMLDFYADWCISCKEMEKFTFSDPGVQKVLANYRLLQADVTKNNEHDKALLKHFGLFGPPSIIFFDHSGAELRPMRLVGFLEAEEFRDHASNMLK